MYYKQKQSLTKKVLTGATLLTSISGCFLSGSDLLAVGADAALGTSYADTENKRTLLRVTRNLAEKDAGRGENRRVKYEDANVGLYAEKGSSNIGVEEERSMRNLDREFSQPIYTEPKTDDKTSKAMREVLGNQDINTRAIIDAVQKEYWKNSSDYERNIGMIDRAYKLEGLTSTDKTRLAGILENIVDEGLDIQNIQQILNKKTLSKIKALEYILNQPEVNSELRTKAINRHLSYSIMRSRIRTYREKDIDGAIKFLRERIDVLYRIKDNVQLSRREFDSIYISKGKIGLIENFLRFLLMRQDADGFKEKVKSFKNIENEFNRNLKEKDYNIAKKTITQEWITKLAKEIGFSAKHKDLIRKVNNLNQ